MIAINGCSKTQGYQDNIPVPVASQCILKRLQSELMALLMSWYSIVLKFVTVCFHPYVDVFGNILLDILQDNKWASAYNVKTILFYIQSLVGGNKKGSLRKKVQIMETTKVHPGNNKGSLRKKVQTMTSILTARSKVACGLTNKPKDPVVDIDAADVDNQLAAVEYVEDIYQFYKLMENESRVHDYMDSQPDINEMTRSILVDWLIAVHHKCGLMPETLYLTLYIVDKFLSIKTVPRRELQLVGIGAMLLASKYEEIWALKVDNFVCISDKAYSQEQVLGMEETILGKLEWSLTVPTLYVFLVRFIKAAVSGQEMENMVFFLAELAMMHYATIMYCPSMVAASAVYAARGTLNKTPLWSETLELHTGYTEPQLMDCAKLLVSFHSKAAESELKVVYKKYSKPQRGAVSLLPPARNLL